MSATTLTPQPQTKAARFRPWRQETQLAAKHCDDVIARFKERVRLHPHFRCRNPMLEFEMQQNRLIVSGHLPSFFLKQLVQEAIRDIDNYEIDNQIIVAADD